MSAVGGHLNSHDCRRMGDAHVPIAVATGGDFVLVRGRMGVSGESYYLGGVR